MRLNTDEKIDELLKKIKLLSVSDQFESLVELYTQNKISLEEFKILCFYLKL